MKKMKRNSLVDTIKHGGMHSFYRRAGELGVSVQKVKNEKNVIKLSHGGKSVYSRRQTIPLQKRLGGFTRDKVLTKNVLRDAGLSVPKGITLKNITQLRDAKKLKYPIISKPLNGTRAKGVTWNIKNEAELKKGIIASKKATKGPVLVEEMFIGDEFRVLVYKDKMLSALHKIPAGVTGNGFSPIKDLIDKFNETRSDGFKIKIDKVARNTLKESGYTLNTILEKGVFFPLRHNLNMSDGGRAVNKTKNLNSVYKVACKKAVKILGLEFGGVDILVKNMSKTGPYVILEVNPNPYYNMHEIELVEGRPIDVSETILKDLFPSLKYKK